MASAVSLLARIALGQVFVIAAINKGTDLEQFAQAIEKFQVPGFRIQSNGPVVSAAAFYLPWLEAVVAMCLIAGLWTRAAAATLVLLLAVFSAAIWSAAIDRGLSLECGCFGKLKGFCRGDAGWCNVIQNGVLAFLGLLALCIGGGRASADALLDRPAQTDGAEPEGVEFA
jgi:uncharacterized membrane protein YphA (DoxX/SURF4 family)